MKKTLRLLWCSGILLLLMTVHVYALGETDRTVMYKITHYSTAGNLTSYTAYSIVAPEESGYWLQRTTHIQIDSKPLSITQTLLDDVTHEPLRYIMHRPANMNRPPSVIDLPLEKMGKDEILPTPITESFVDAGRIQVAAGEFEAQRGEVGNRRLWVGLEVPVVGVIKVEAPEWTMELFQIDYHVEDLLSKKPVKGGMVYLEEK